MAIRSRFFILLMFFTGCFIFAQTETPHALSYTIEGTRFIQRLDWTPIDGIIRYEIILEQRYGNSEQYGEFLRETTEKPFLEVSLPAGNYRYKILGYNILDRLGAESDYQPFEVFQAVLPVINGISSPQLFLEEDNRRITLRGEHLVPDGEIYLVPERSNTNSIDQAGVLIPSHVIYSDIGGSAELIFDGQELPPGRYRIVMVNPGGLMNTYGPFEVRTFRKAVDINVSAGYAPLIPLNVNDQFKYVIQDPVYPLGFAARISLVPIKTRFGYFGAEFSPFYTYAESRSDVFTFNMHIIGASLSILYQIPFLGEKLFLNILLGGGFASFLNMQFTYANDIKETSSFAFSEAEARISVRYFIYKQVFLELGANLKLFFPENLITGYISPELSAGWKF